MPVKQKLQRTATNFLPINTKVGEKFQVSGNVKPIVYLENKKLEDYVQYCGYISNLCETKNVETAFLQTYTESGNDNVGVIIIGDYIFERSTGILLEQIFSIDVWDKNNFDSKYIEFALETIDFPITPQLGTTKETSTPKIVPEPTKESVIQKNVESPSIPIPTIPEQKESSSVEIQESSEEDEFYWGYFALGFFFVIGMPIIIIALIVWKIKRWRTKRKLNENKKV